MHCCKMCKFRLPIASFVPYGLNCFAASVKFKNISTFMLPTWVNKYPPMGIASVYQSFSGDIQDPPGQGPLQPTVGDPASAGGLD